jgi:hypothetical protein
VSRIDGLGRGSGGDAIGAVSIGPIAGATSGAVVIARASGFNEFCSTACADAVSAINPMAASLGTRIKAKASVFIRNPTGNYIQFKFPVLAYKFPVLSQKFPVLLRREFRSKSSESLDELQPLGPELAQNSKIPC